MSVVKISFSDVVEVIINYERRIAMALVREQTIPTERPLLVGEVTANICG
jgi:hypothetical protein